MKIKKQIISGIAAGVLLSISTLSIAEESDLRMVFSEEVWEENQDNKLAQFYIAEQKYLSNKFDAALRWYLRSANNGFDRAVDNAKIMIQNDLGVKDNMHEVVNFLTTLGLERNDLFAQMYLGDIYRDGRYSTNHERSYFWYSKAAEQADPRAEYYVANMSVVGIGTPQNVPRGVRLLEKVSERGHMGAIYNLGKIYKRGFNIPQNHREAVKWFEKNAENGHIDSMFELADSYERGFGVERSNRKALDWYKEAAAHNHLEATARAGVVHVLNRDVSSEFDLNSGLRYLVTAAENGHLESQLRLGDIYYVGSYGVSKDFLIALKYYNMAASQNDQSAYKKLSFIYREGGYGIARDNDKYQEYIEKYYTYEPNLRGAPKDRLNLFNYNIFIY